MDAGENEIRLEKPATALRRGWTTGACATAATKSALTALLTGEFPDPVEITLPRGEIPSFALARETLGGDHAMAGIVKDAGDDPDVTHGALVMATVRRLPEQFRYRLQGRCRRRHGHQGRPPYPRRRASHQPGPAPDDDAGGDRPLHRARHRARHRDRNRHREWRRAGAEDLEPAARHHRRAIRAGHHRHRPPFSCAAWIHSIHRGIDVARAEGLKHVLGATGSTRKRPHRSSTDFQTSPVSTWGISPAGCSSISAPIRCRA
jgi:cobalt-precorrin-5B (C1)-methyltransferase